MDIHPIRLAISGFEGIQKDPFSWADEAKNLAEAAALIWDAYKDQWEILEDFIVKKRAGMPAESVPRHLGLWKPAFLNLGLAVENQLKAIVLDRSKVSIVKGKVRWPGNGHDQLALAQVAGLVLSDQEMNVLKFLQEFVLWAGRYPLPNSEADLEKNVVTEGNQWDKARNLFLRLQSECRRC